MAADSTIEIEPRRRAVEMRSSALPQADDEYVFSSALVTLAAPNSRAAEAVGAIRTHVISQHIHLGRRALAVCSPSIDVGCSFVATNLAVALSQTGLKTLLVDGDLRNPSLERFIRPPNPRPGLAEALASADTDFSRCIDADVLPDLSVVYAGETTAAAQEQLAGDRFQAFADSCLREFEVTIIDTPPANTYSDARLIAAAVGYALIVAARDLTFTADVKTLSAQLEADQAKVVGTVLNRA